MNSVNETISKIQEVIKAHTGGSSVAKHEGSEVVKKVGLAVGETAARVVNGSVLTVQETKKNSKLFGTSVIAGFVAKRAEFQLKQLAEQAPKVMEQPKA